MQMCSAQRYLALSFYLCFPISLLWETNSLMVPSDWQQSNYFNVSRMPPLGWFST